MQKQPLGSPEQPLIFTHVPKSSGTAFFHYLRAHFPPEQVGPPLLGDRSQIGKQRGYALYGQGHIPFRFVKDIEPANHFTFLRDPLARAISQYQSWHDPKNFGPAWRAQADAATLEMFAFVYNATVDEFLLSERPGIVRNMSNIHVQLLSSVPANHPQFLHSAMQNLESRFAFFGILERFEESIELLRRGFEAGPYEAARVNENRSPRLEKKPSEQALDRVRSLNDLDFQLYERAVQIFSERLQQSRNEL